PVWARDSRRRSSLRALHSCGWMGGSRETRAVGLEDACRHARRHTHTDSAFHRTFLAPKVRTPLSVVSCPSRELTRMHLPGHESGIDRCVCVSSRVERVTGIEPAPSAWKAEALPLSYTREAGPTLPAQ